MFNLLKKKRKEPALTPAPILEMVEIFDDEIRSIYQGNNYSLTLESLDFFSKSDLMNRLQRKLAQNELALLSDFCKALLVHLTMVMKPKKVLEIGTYKAGTAYNIASALKENGEGLLTTIDPFERFNKARGNIAQFPEDIRVRIDQRDVSSSDFFNEVTFAELQYELIFIDGNHNYEYAYFDLINSAKFVTPGGLIILDNVDQIGPRFAAKKFLADNPNWIDFMGVISQKVPEGHSPLDFYMTSEQEPTNYFYILQAPKEAIVGSLPVTIGPKKLKNKSAHSVRVECKNEVKGKWHFLIYLRAFFPEASPQEIRVSKSIAIDSNKQKEYLIPLFEGEDKGHLRGGGSSYTVEYSYSFEPEIKRENLVLAAPPEIMYSE